MKKYLKLGSLILVFFMSFYITNYLGIHFRNQNPLMIKIKDEAHKYMVQPVNAIINDDYIIPGLSGTEIDINRSFIKMKQLGKFNENFMFQNEILPEISITNNRGKIIQSGNPYKRMISIIINNDKIKNYCCHNKIEANEIVNKNNYQNSCLQVINNDYQDYDLLESNLKHHKINNMLCLVNDYIKQKCVNSNKYLIKPTYSLNNSNIIEIRNNINSGSILYIEDTAKIEDFMLLLKDISYKDFKIVHLTKLIDEKEK